MLAMQGNISIRSDHRWWLPQGLSTAFRPPSHLHSAQDDARWGSQQADRRPFAADFRFATSQRGESFFKMLAGSGALPRAVG